MVSGDFTSGGSDEEESISVFTGDFDVGFITGLSGIDGAFEFQIELMAVRGGIESVVEDGLIRGLKLEDILKNKGGFAGGDAQRDVKG